MVVDRARHLYSDNQVDDHPIQGEYKSVSQINIAYSIYMYI